MSAAPTIDLPAPPRSHGVTRLSEWGLIRATGEDAASFLNGQLTNEMLGLRPGEARLAGYCSAKGRLLASFIVWSPAPQEFLLACSAELLPATLKRLSMFVLRAKCKLSDASAEWALWGWAGAEPAPGLAAPWPAAPWTVGSGSERTAFVRLPDVAGLHRGLWVVPADAAAPHPAGLPPADLDPALWRWLEVASGVVRIVPQTVEQFVPQMVNLELVGGVSFKKGCYPGQEVVARSQYRGTLKRRGALLQCAAPMVEGQEVFQAQDPGQPAGQVALSAAGPDGHHLALVELKLAALDAGDLHLGAPDGPLLTPAALPYDVPRDEH